MSKKISTGTILLAEPFMVDPNFKRSVVLLCDHSKEEGTVGFVLNKNLGLQVNELILDFPSFDAEVYYGGPVQTDSIHYIHNVGDLLDNSTKVGIVIGGGNIFRGISGASQGMDRVQADHMGMLATVINGLALQGALESAGVKTRLQSAIEMDKVAEPFIRRRAIRHLEKGRVVIFSAGTGNPYFTTDTGATLRAVEIQADVILKGTRVDGIYTADPEKDESATKFKELSFKEVYDRGLNVMDMTAFTLSRENDLPIIVFDMNTKGNLMKVVEGADGIGTLVKN